MSSVVLSINSIISNPKIRNGRPIIAGSSLCVSDIAVRRVFWNQTPDEIEEQFQIALPHVYAALAYYYEHQEEIDADIQRQNDLFMEAKEKRIGARHNSLLP